MAPQGHYLEPLALLERLHQPPSHPHAAQHRLQILGTSLGQFVTDISEIATSTILSNVSFGLRHGRRRGWPLRPWAEQETHPVVAQMLQATLELHESCQRLSHLTLDAHLSEGLGEFNRLYQEILLLQQDRPRPRWRLPRQGLMRRLDTPPPQAPAVIASGRMILEAAAQLAQIEDLPDPVSRDLPATARHTLNPLRSLLPNDPGRARWTALYLLDLALMAPVGRYHCTAPVVQRTSDLLPGARLLEAVRAANELDIMVSADGSNGTELVEMVCDRLNWPKPGWMAFRARELAPRHDPQAAQNLVRWQEQAMALRQRQPSLFALPDACALAAHATLEHLGVYDTDPQILEPGSPPLQVLCANLWIEGESRDPNTLVGPLRQAPDLQQRIRDTFQLLFALDLDDVKQL